MAKPKANPVPRVPTVAPITWPDFKDVGARLNLTRSGLRQLVRREGVAPVRDRCGRLRMDPILVERFEAKRAARAQEQGMPPQRQRPRQAPAGGAMAAAVFKRLAAGEDPIAIVIAEQAEPDDVDQYRARYDSYKNQVTYTGKELLVLCDRLGVASNPLPTVQALLDGLAEREAHDRRMRDEELQRRDAEVKVLREQLAKSTKALESAAAAAKDHSEKMAKMRVLAQAHAEALVQLEALKARVTELEATAPPIAAGPSTAGADPTEAKPVSSNGVAHDAGADPGHRGDA